MKLISWRFPAVAGVSALMLSGGMLAGTIPITTSVAAAATGGAPQLHVSGNVLVDQSGARVVLHGANRSGGEFGCVQDTGIWNGPMDQASIDAMKSWDITAVRVPLNEACWNAESYVDPAYAGTTYQNAVKAYVNLLNANGLAAILDLHWTDGAYTGNSSACSSAQATCQKPMPDAAEAIPFWTSVATAFKGNDSVIFDLFNEPYPERATGSETSGWQCWRSGGTCSGIGYQVAGMQSMVNAVRSTGATNVLMLGGLAYSNDLTQWLQYKPSDPDNKLVASWHSYNFNTCSSQSCWTSQVAPVIASVPLIAGEIGENDCGDSYINPLMSWLDGEHTGYLAWTWNNWNCNSGPALITDYTGTPTPYGSGYKAHLISLAGGGGGGGGGSGYVRFENHATGLYIDGEGRTSNGSNTGQWSSSTSSNQQWTIVADGSYVRLQNRATGLFLDGEGRTSNGSVAGQWSNSTSNNQQWAETTVGSYVKFKNRATGLYLDGEGRTSNGSDLGQWSSSTSNNQQWQVVAG